MRGARNSLLLKHSIRLNTIGNWRFDGVAEWDMDARKIRIPMIRNFSILCSMPWWAYLASFFRRRDVICASYRMPQSVGQVFPSCWRGYRRSYLQIGWTTRFELFERALINNQYASAFFSSAWGGDWFYDGSSFSPNRHICSGLFWTRTCRVCRSWLSLHIRDTYLTGKCGSLSYVFSQTGTPVVARFAGAH